MTVLALILGLDPLYVGIHHLVRFLGIGLVLPFVIGWLQRSTARDLRNNAYDLSFRSRSTASMRGLAVSQRRFVTAATRASVSSRRPADESQFDGATMWAGSTCRATRAMGESQGSVSRTTVAPCFAAVSHKRHDVLLVAADVEGDDHVLAADLDHPVAPEGGLALDEIHMAAHDAEMALGIARERAGEAAAGEMDVPARIAEQGHHRLELGRGDVLHRGPQIPDHRFRKGSERRRALALVGGAGLGERREELGLQLLAQVLLEIRKAAEIPAA